MNNYEQYIHITDKPFEKMVADADRVIQKLIKNMVSKGSLEGSVTIKIDVSLEQDVVENYDSQIPGTTRRILVPSFAHKVSSVMQVKDDVKGVNAYQNFELVYDESSGEFIIRPVANTSQTSFYDDQDPDAKPQESADDLPQIDASTAALPPHDDGEDLDAYEYDDPVDDE